MGRRRRCDLLAPLAQWSPQQLLSVVLLVAGMATSYAGLLKVGRPLPWHSSLPHLQYVRHHGVKQFLNVYHRLKDITQDELLWGDEIEYGIFKVDRDSRQAWLALRGKEVMDKLTKKEEEYRDRLEGCSWHPEFGSWMVESTPSKPYAGYATDLVRVEANMRLRRKRLLTVLDRDEISPTMTCFPLMGVGEFTQPPAPPGGPISESTYAPDSCINPHPRFGTLVKNIRSRRGQKVDIRVPLFEDKATPEYREKKGGQPPVINMDAMAFGMGCCCLQVTFQARDIDESRYMYDQLAVLAPLLLALTAASPIFKGRLADTDVRWDVIAASVDDRTPAERGEVADPAVKEGGQGDARLAGAGKRRLLKSRYDSISTFIYACEGRDVIGKYNDVPCEVDEELLTMLREGGVDEALARHIAHLFVRDPLVIFEDSIEVDDSKTTEHFENIQTVRWKPPPVRTNPDDPHIGWRTEFRSMELQLTDFENAAFTVFVILLTRIILAFDLTLYISLSKVDENMRRAHARDAVLRKQFFFRKHLAPLQSPSSGFSECGAMVEDDDFEEMTLAEILTGKGDYFVGLIPLCYMYLDYIGCDRETFKKVSSYLEYIKKRGTGETLTTAAWMRKFVEEHEEYRHDSVVSPGIAYDLVMACKRIGEGRQQCPDVLGDIVIDPIFATEAYPVALSGDKMQSTEKAKLFRALLSREPFHRGRPVQPSYLERDFFT